MVVACIALVFAMTGAGYAAGMLGPNTVGTKQLKKNAVISSKVKNRSLLAVDFKAGQLPRGAKGDPGTPGAPGAPGAPGQQGPPGPFPDPLQAGNTVRGTFVITDGTSAGAPILSFISFGFRLAAPPTPHYIRVGDPPVAQCPGTVTNPQAAPGHLCAYEATAVNVNAGRGFCNPEVSGCTFANPTTREGTAVYANATVAGVAATTGSWAVTAGSSASKPESRPSRSGSLFGN
jgi:hypothetical protein